MCETAICYWRYVILGILFYTLNVISYLFLAYMTSFTMAGIREAVLNFDNTTGGSLFSSINFNDCLKEGIISLKMLFSSIFCRLWEHLHLRPL